MPLGLWGSEEVEPPSRYPTAYMDSFGIGVEYLRWVDTMGHSSPSSTRMSSRYGPLPLSGTTFPRTIGHATSMARTLILGIVSQMISVSAITAMTSLNPSLTILKRGEHR